MTKYRKPQALKKPVTEYHFDAEGSTGIYPTAPVSDITPISNAITFTIEGKDILKLHPDGKIEWNLHDKSIYIEDHKLLCAALIDLVVQLSGGQFDLAKAIDPELYTEYQRIIANEKIDK